MSDEKTYHLINQYLRGELIGSKLDSFKAQMKSDSQFAMEVEMQEEIIAVVEQVREQELKDYLKVNAKVSYFNNSWGKKWNYASAAIVILFVSTFFIIKSFFPQQSGDKRFGKKDSKENPEEIIPDSLFDSTALVVDESTKPEITEEKVSENEPLPNDSLGKPQNEEASGSVPMAVEDTEQEEELDVKKDELLSSKIFLVNTISPSFEESAVSKRSRKKEKDANNAGDMSDTLQSAYVYKTTASRNIEVEYWQSPVNFKGYNYNQDRLKLYGIESEQGITFKELDKRLYMYVNDKYYYLEKNGNYNKLIEVTNPTVLDVLNE